MTTVDKTFADNIVLNKGWYNGDDDNSMGDNPKVIRIWEYTTAFGNRAYKLIFSRHRDIYYDGSQLTRATLYADIP